MNFTFALMAGPVRNAVSNRGEAGPGYDGSTNTWWESLKSGDSLSLLFEAESEINSAVALTRDTDVGSTYQLLVSDNYRDWDLVSEELAYPLGAESRANLLEGARGRYLRFMSMEDGVRFWELSFGEAGEVESWLELQRPFDWGDVRDPDVIVEMLDRAFEWQLANESEKHEGKGWITGAFYTGVSALASSTGSEKYSTAIFNHGQRSSWELHDFTWGKKFYHADNQCIGQTWLRYYLSSDTPRALWISDLRSRIDRIMADPLPGREDYSWCDALYMGPPNYALLTEATGDISYMEFIEDQWWDSVEFLYDTEYKLFYRDANFFDAKEPNGMPVFWGRGNGWVIAATVHMLETMPTDWPTRDRYLKLYREMADSIESLQGDDGLWSASLLDPGQFDFERETSCSAFFTYALAWGVNEGLLDESRYGPSVEQAWDGLSQMLLPSGILQLIQQEGNAPALNNGLLENKGYGAGAFLLAGVEMIDYYRARAVPASITSGRRSLVDSQVVGNGESDWVVVEDFEDSFNWTVQKTVTSSERLRPDPNDLNGSRVFSINTGMRTTGVYRATVDMPEIRDGDTATLYARFAYDSPDIDIVFGVSDQSVVDEYSDYETGLRVYAAFNQLEARSGDKYVVLSKDFLELGSWYEVWTVVDNTRDTYDIYLRGGSNYPLQTQVGEDVPFRNGTGQSLARFAVSFNGALSDGTFYLDDVYLDPSGLNLSRPAEVGQPNYSPWARTGKDRENGSKATYLGKIWDSAFPWIYHDGLGAWGYILFDDVPRGGVFAWMAGLNDWVWFPDFGEGWYYKTGSRQWRNWMRDQ